MENKELTKNKNTKFSVNSLIRALLLSLNKTLLGDFIVQQNEIQFLLTSLILLRLKKHGLIDKKWIERMETFSLGKIIFIYKTCASQTIKERNLVKNLENYNSGRNKIIHKLFEMFHEEVKKVKSTQTKKIGKLKILVQSLGLGEKIKTDLIDLLEEEIKT
jgi:hypothetical protein